MKINIKNNIIRTNWLLKAGFILFLVGSLLMSSCQAQRVPETTGTSAVVEQTNTPSLEPTKAPTATATATPVPTDVPTLEPTATITPLPTRTPTPLPTLTPVGFFRNANGAYSWVLPLGWTMLFEDGAIALAENAENGNRLLGVVTDRVEEVSYEDILLLISGGDESILDNVRESTSTIGGDVEAKKYTTTWAIPDAGVTLGIQLSQTEEGSKRYFFGFFGIRERLNPSQIQMNSMLDGIKLYGSQVYGLERKETIVLMGWRPDPIDLDPATQSGSAADYSGLLFRGLVQLSPELAVEPDLAESWEIRPDGLVYTFTLKLGVSFQDGTPITAEDVVFSLERAANPEIDSPTARTYLGDILGVNDRLDGNADTISGLRAIDDRKVEITLDAPKAYFLQKLTYPTGYVVDQRDIDADPEEWMFSPNASGPYFLKEYIENDVLIFERNTYYQPLAGTPYIVFMLFRGGTDKSYYEADEIDVTWLGSLDARLILEDPANPLNDELITAVDLCTSYIALNNTIPPFDDPLVRKAFALSIDRARLIDQFSDGMELAAYSLLPPAMPGFKFPENPMSYDPGAAQAALAASSYSSELPKIVLNSGGYSSSEGAHLTLLVSMWKETLGAEFQLENLDPDDWSRALRLAEGHITSFGWCADYPDPENFLDVLFHSDSEFNVGNYSNPTFDSLVEQARIEPDAAMRIDLYQQAEAILLADYALIPLDHSIGFSLVKPYLVGYIDPPMGVPIWPLVRIEH